jgi:hypothetical protein
MDSATFTSSSKETQVLEYAITGMYADILTKQYGDDLVKDITQARDAIRDLVSKSVESREQAVYLSKKFFGENAVVVMNTFQQRLAEANKVPKKSKRSSSSSKQVKSEKVLVESKVLKLEAGDSTVVEMVQDESSIKKSKSKISDKVEKDDKDKSTVSDPSSPPKDEKDEIDYSKTQKELVKPELKKMKSSSVAKKRKIGGEIETEA